MTQNIVWNLLNLALSKDNSDGELSQRQRAIVASPLNWESVLMELNLNEVTPLAALTLKHYHLGDSLPPSSWDKIQSAYRQTRMLNTFMFLTVYRILQALSEANLNPIVGSNIVLADSLYPDLGARSLNHIDITLSLAEVTQAKDVLESLGFTLVSNSESCLYVRNSIGIICQLQLSSVPDLLSLTTEIQPQHIQLPNLTILEPNAMLVELVKLMRDGDYSSSHIALKSIVDIALVLQKWGASLEPHRLQILMAQGSDRARLWRIIRFLETKLGQHIPAWLSEAAQNAHPLQTVETRKLPRFIYSGSQVEELRRSHTMHPGYANIVARRDASSYQNRLALEVSDLVLQATPSPIR
jgi:hypothetical protein